MKSRSGARRDRKCDEMRVRWQEGEQAVVRGHEKVAPRGGGEHPAVGADPRIDDGEVHASLREPVPHARQDVLRRAHVTRRDLVRDVDQDDTVDLRQEHPLYFRHVAVGASAVGEERNEGGHG